MGAYARKLKTRGTRWFYSGMYISVKYHSQAIYLTKQEALKAERERRDEIDHQQRHPTRMKLKTLIENRLDHIQTTKSRFYYKENHRYFKKALDAWGNPDVQDITKQMVNKLLLEEAKRLKADGKSNHKVNAMIRSLKALFNWGNKVYDLDIKNPCVFEMYPIDINLKYIPSDDEIITVKDKSTAMQNFLIDFVDQTGCRIMEAIRLKYEDIDGELVTLWTRKAKYSNLTPRRIPKPACLDGIVGKGQVFTDWQSYPRFLEDRTGHKWNWHNLRHRRASIWAKDGLTTFEIMVRLGHNNLSTTMKYLQLLGFTRL